MKITLKKAAEYARQAQATAAAIETPGNVTLSVYSTQTTHEAAAAGRESTLANLDASNDLIYAAYALRAHLGRVNAETGISDRLARIAAVEAVIKRYAAVLDDTGDAMSHLRGGKPDTDLDAAQARKQALRETAAASERSYSRDDTITLPLIDPATRTDLEAKIAQTRRKIAALKDEVTLLNFSTTIELPETETTILRKHGIID